MSKVDRLDIVSYLVFTMALCACAFWIKYDSQPKTEVEYTATGKEIVVKHKEDFSETLAKSRVPEGFYLKSYNDSEMIIVDEETKVEYYYTSESYRKPASLTPLLDENGKPKLDKQGE